MADVALCDPFELYNLLNQRRRASRLAEINYLYLVDAREIRDYRISHVVTAENIKTDADGAFLPPVAVEVDSMQHVVVYDSDTTRLQEQGRAVGCALMLAEASRHPVRVVRGGFRRFSALYPFLRTVKILYTVTELEELKTYPVEVLAGLVYMGDQKQGRDVGILRDLRISAVVSVSETDALEPPRRSQAVLNVPVADSLASDLYSWFDRICAFIDSQISTGSRVLIVSRQGRSRCGAATVAFLMHHLKYPLQEAWSQTLRCKPSMRPNTKFLQQLSEWELHTTGAKVTDISECPF
ncbi:serine/threonine/tyrosine-interacting-like protein 1 [Brachionichthys hirsutus]|uniref:serine/threonine/tyrosine-interacting-like protein 1 n=1 Tax=Brachionichthys hirsutus TaxID=412623 RepID=UPI003604AD9C